MAEPTNDAGLAEVCPQKTGMHPTSVSDIVHQSTFKYKGINHCAQGKEPCGSDETEILVLGGADDSTHRGSKSKSRLRHVANAKCVCLGGVS